MTEEDEEEEEVRWLIRPLAATLTPKPTARPEAIKKSLPLR